MLDAIKDDGSSAASIEVTPARRGKLDAYMITSHAPTLPVVRFKPEPLAGAAKPDALVAAITVQKPEPKIVEFPKIARTGGGKGVQALCDGSGKTWNVALDETAGSWVCANADLAEGVPIESGRFCRLYFEMNRLPDADGNYHDHATPQLRLNGRDEKGALVFGDWRVPMYKRGGWAFRTDNDPETWETVWIGIDKGTLPDQMRKLISVGIQFQMMPAEHSGLAFRNFRLEEAE